MDRVIFLIFFLSGASALIFEAVWFRVAGLTFGNSVWSATLVLGGFMGGLALGNAAIARFGHYIHRPIRVYALLEVIIGFTGLALVFLFPLLPRWLAPVFRLAMDNPWVLNPLRLSIVFILLLVPTTAMGATLPLLVKGLSRVNVNFGTVLGRLYGSNTLGAVVGVLIAEIMLIRWFGLLGAGVVAVLFNLAAAFGAMRVSENEEMIAVKQNSNPLPHSGTVYSLAVKRLLFVAFLAGAALLALEVIWFRLLLLTSSSGTSLIFAVMLAVVLAGIGVGGLVAGWWLKINPDAHKYLRALLFLSGILTVISFKGFDLFTSLYSFDNPYTVIFVVLAVLLMLPVSLVSGMVFTMLGKTLKDELVTETKATGLLTLMNTTGAMLGSFIAGFFLLPVLGLEYSFFILGLTYATAAIVVSAVNATAGRQPAYLLGALFLLCSIFFPFGLMKDAYARLMAHRYPGAQVAALREGLTETIIYSERKFLGDPFYYQLITNGFSMSATSTYALRYMKLFVYLPIALQQDPKRALLISYGVGATAKALTDTKNLDSIDIVDISRDILQMNSIVYPDIKESPLGDGRVKVYIEDGRFFLSYSDRRYDLITSEPPPPKLSGVVNLYTQEYFQLIYDHLSDGGMTSYWLPVNQLFESDAAAIIKAFCNVFSDCTLWSGAGLDWVLMGARNAKGQASVQAFSHQWSDPIVGPELRSLGFEKPAQLASLFLADKDTLSQITNNSGPLTDNFPHRLSTDLRDSSAFSPLYAGIMEYAAARQRFQHSSYIERRWPKALRQENLKYFEYQRMATTYFAPEYSSANTYMWEDLYRVLHGSDLQTLPLWMLGSDHRAQEIVHGMLRQNRSQPGMYAQLAIGAIAGRDYENAIRHIRAHIKSSPEEGLSPIAPYYVFALCMSKKFDEADKILRKAGVMFGNEKESSRFIDWLSHKFPIKKM